MTQNLGHVKILFSSTDDLFLDRQGGKAIASAHQVQEAAFSSTGRGERPLQVHIFAFSLTGRGKRLSQAHAKNSNKNIFRVPVEENCCCSAWATLSCGACTGALNSLFFDREEEKAIVSIPREP